ncbi:MAG TPA: ankyrin repeat domain-containing protein [Cyclobacteriaceae bacterium]|nr:ankyrin repeat domain-containing protein [Cyclobacteriaceae bacterium]
MLQPAELKLDLPVELSNGAMSSTSMLWKILLASKEGDLDTIRKLAGDCPELIYGQYNYTPPIHLAVREGHVSTVKYLLDNGAYDPRYKTYPFQDSLLAIANERGHHEIKALLNEYGADSSRQKYRGDNGKILYPRSELQQEFERAVEQRNIERVSQLLKTSPDLIKDETYFWGEGILLFAVKENNRPMIDLLTRYGAKVPVLLKWTQFYYFEHDDGAAYIMKKGMNPNTMSWHHVTILHDMAQKGNISKAELLLNYGAEIDPIDEEYQSTPLGMAARWGHIEMARYLLKKGANPNKAGASWATPLEWAKLICYDDIEAVLRNAGATN